VPPVRDPADDGTTVRASTERGPTERGPLWIFGYGSLIWRPDFVWAERRTARVTDRARRFWQGSHDHRGVPGAPGRVVTLVPEPGGRCEGMAWRIADERAEETLARLDHREKDGYVRERLVLHLDDGRRVTATTWVASPLNPSWLGPAPLDELAATIRSSAGPSGTNADYVLSLADGLERLGFADPHVAELATRLRRSQASPECRSRPSSSS